VVLRNVSRVDAVIRELRVRTVLVQYCTSYMCAFGEKVPNDVDPDPAVATFGGSGRSDRNLVCLCGGARIPL